MKLKLKTLKKSFKEKVDERSEKVEHFTTRRRWNEFLFNHERIAPNKSSARSERYLSS